MKIEVIFYKGKGDFLDKLIRLFTRSIYSHCEVKIGNIFYGVNPAHNKVSKYYRDFKKEDWDSIKINITKKNFEIFFSYTKNKKYDWKGIFFSQIFPFKIHSKNKYFCSEWCAELLGLDRPYKYSPKKLFRYLNKNHIGE